MSVKAYYQASFREFIEQQPDYILGQLTRNNQHALEELQRRAWLRQISVLKGAVPQELDGRIFFEFQIPRMGKRVDVLLLVANRVLLLEFKVGADVFTKDAAIQVLDYALDLKNFHAGSHSAAIVPIIIATDAEQGSPEDVRFAADRVAAPLLASSSNLREVIRKACAGDEFFDLDHGAWMDSGYRPTPTIVEAAQALYQNHSVADISRSDAGAINLQSTSEKVAEIIDRSRRRRRKSLCFVTGVPGSGKTLAGLNIATRQFDEHRNEHAVFLSGNGPLVIVLREALARDKVVRDGCSKKDAHREVRSFIQNIHHFRDQYVDTSEIPVERVVIFDEAQRAWSRRQAAKFMRERGHSDFDMSEPEFLISVMDRHTDWCTVVCLVGGGQEINTGEAGISEWISALQLRFSEWDIYISPRILRPEYGVREELENFLASPSVESFDDLHLGVSMRSFRAEKLSDFIGHVIDGEMARARDLYAQIRGDYPIVLTRSLGAAKDWLRRKARGSERYGLVASSGAQRLRPEGIHIKAKVDPECWFLNGNQDVRSSFYLEEVATQFDVQGLELDWAGVCWDGDFYYREGEWAYQSFRGTNWSQIRDESNRLYLKNAYRVILTRARQGMVIFVPCGSADDLTRRTSFYDGTYQFLRSCGIDSLDD